MSRIIWSSNAHKEYSDFLDSLAQISVDAAFALERKVEKLMSQLQAFKHSCPKSDFKEGHRRCVVTKNFSITYRIRKDTVYIVSAGANRRNR